MRAYVLRDAALTKYAGQFAWLSIDSDKPKNSAFVEKFPIQGWPSFLVIDPAAEKIALKWYGSATAEQLAKLAEDGARAMKGGGEGAEAALARADGLNADGKPGEAAAAYREAIQAGGPKWPRRERTIESLVMAYQFARQQQDCARVATEFAPGMSRGRSFTNVLYFGLECAVGGGQADWAKSAVGQLRPLAEQAVRIPGVLGDDRAQLYATLLDLYGREKDTEAGKKLSAEFLAFLDEHEKTAPSAEARASLDSYRVMMAMRQKDPARAIPALQASERDLPNDYNPPARLTTLYNAMGRYDEALAASGRALAKVYGPRRIQVLTTRSGILEKKGDKEAARRTIEEAIRFASTIPKGERQVENLKKQLERFK
jgi:tetratricopeptide (TPR) repeat protein